MNSSKKWPSDFSPYLSLALEGWLSLQSPAAPGSSFAQWSEPYLHSFENLFALTLTAKTATTEV